MRRARNLLLTLPALLLVAACSGGGSTAAPDMVPDTSSPDPRVLPIGKADLPLTPGTHYSPLDFVPPLALDVPAGWSSTHRGDDAFDVGKDGVVIVFLTPDGETVAPVLQQLKAKMPHPTPVTGTLAGQPATGFDATGGTGELITSPSRTISLDLAPKQRVRVLGTDIDGVPLIAVVLVPDGAKAPALLPQAVEVLGHTTPG